MSTNRQPDFENDDCTVAVCKCGGLVFAGVTHTLTAKDRRVVGDLAVDGYEIRHFRAADVRKMSFACTCPKPATGDMFAPLAGPESGGGSE